MSTDETENTEEVAAPNDGAAKSITLTLKETVAEQVVQAAPNIRDGVVDALAQPEIRSRTQLLVDAYTKVQKLRVDLSKIDRPDVDPKDRNGKSLGQASYSDARVKEIKKLSEEITKWDKAITQAWGEEVTTTDESGTVVTGIKQDFKKLKELLGNKSGSEQA